MDEFLHDSALELVQNILESSNIDKVVCRQGAVGEAVGKCTYEVDCLCEICGQLCGVDVHSGGASFKFTHQKHHLYLYQSCVIYIYIVGY